MGTQFKLKDFKPGVGSAKGTISDKFEIDDWIDVPVPRDVHQALQAACRIPDPFYNQNELECTWIEVREWWYRADMILITRMLSCCAITA